MPLRLLLIQRLFIVTLDTMPILSMTILRCVTVMVKVNT